MKLRSGHIPVDIVYIFGPAIKVTRRWDEADQPEEDLVYTEVTPVFISDATNEKTIASGMRWAKQQCNRYNQVTKQIEEVGTVSTIKKENKPISSLQVIGLEHRSEGGRAYKVRTPDGFYCDLREDVLLEAMLSKGIQPGGVLGGEYLWARVGNEMKLVRKDSELFYALLESGERMILSAVPKNKLEVGCIYESKQGDRGIFLGYVTTESWKLKWPNKQSAFSNFYLKTNVIPILSRKNIKQHTLWFDVSNWQLKNKKTDPTPQLFIDAMNEESLVYNFRLKAKPSVVRAVGKVNVPDNVVEEVRNKALVSYKTNVQYALHHEARNAHFYNIEQVVIAAVPCLLMRKEGEPRPVVTESQFQQLEQLIGKEVQRC